MPNFYRFNRETGQEQQVAFNSSHCKELHIMDKKYASYNAETLTRLHQLELVNKWNRQALHSQWEYYL